jgi:hypothetical protein
MGAGSYQIRSNLRLLPAVRIAPDRRDGRSEEGIQSWTAEREGRKSGAKVAKENHGNFFLSFSRPSRNLRVLRVRLPVFHFSYPLRCAPPAADETVER